MSDCNCTMVQKLVGDGCSTCNPQLTIEHLQDEIDEYRIAIQKWKDNPTTTNEFILKDLVE